ncbi:hypothetical protein FSPOR_6656 [Fusarium sporotrichioides]|uniref:Uncharacterized protein n=1 Tax=Fusarium sporotrichioides TaxID=5514 RepID=A0A395S1J5_FUSSP|nr:hypothetical protein FSPOR_6656 [Fusarium sporotrichioides]
MAKASEEPPFITFKIYPDRIVTDCNSDDLTKADLQAICQPANKEQTKGASLKTIVAATKRTHIQSGNFSFEFQHNIFDVDDSDTMRPVWITPAEIVPDNVTRITLYLHDQGSKKEIQSLRDVIISQFEGLQQESVLFLKDIKSMGVECCDKDGKIHRSKHFQRETADEHRVSLKFTTVDRSEEHTHTQLYHVTEQPSDDPSANVILAFPLTQDFKVEVDDKVKRIFNFVPLGTCPLGFHIHSDLDMEDDGNDTITASAHNLVLQNEIATLFFKTILQFCEHPTLKYHWPLFLSSGVTERDPFWSALDSDIRSWISRNPVFVSRHVKHWRLISHLASPGPDAQDDSGNPLLDDSINDPFLSSRYPPKATDILREYGLAALTSAQCLDLVEMHFNDPSLRLCTTSQVKEWHSAIDRLLSKLLTHDEYLDRIRSLPLLQLRGGCMISAASASSEPVYFPTTENLEIPENLGLRVINDSGGNGRFSKTLYKQLGVIEASVNQVRNSILKTFSSSKGFTLDEIKTYLRYLYLTHKSFDISHEQSYRAVRIITQEKEVKKPWDDTIYLPGRENPYTPQSLLGVGLFGLSEPIDYLHPYLLEAAPKQSQLFHIAWKTWLCDCLGMKERLSLVQSKPCLDQISTKGASSTNKEMSMLSDSCKYVLKNRPDRFLGLVQHLWPIEGPRMMESPSLLSEIQGLPVKGLCGLERSVDLRDTWIPLQPLKDFVKKFMEYPDKFPFLKLPEEKFMSFAIVVEWQFLTTHLGVKHKFDLDFLLGILESIKHSCNKLSSSQISKVFALYSVIRTSFLTCAADEKQRALEFFEDSGILYMDETGPIWTGTSSCVWAAPTNMVSRYSLKRLYQDKVHDKEKFQDLSHFVCVILSIRDVTVQDLVEELRLLRTKDHDTVRVANIYRYLDTELKASPEMRAAFGESPLIVVQKGDMSRCLSTKYCFWSEAETTSIESSLKKCYPDLKGFFLEKLGVRISSYDGLVNFTSTDVDEAKKSLLSFMDEAEFLHEYPPEPIQRAKIFPVEYPATTGQPRSSTKLCSLETEFFIGDRDYLKKPLQSKVKMLSFNVTEVRRLQPLFRWLSIEDRYLSKCVEEMLDVVPSSNSIQQDVTSIQSTLCNKAYHIARVGETFNSYGSCDDAFSLYQKLRAMKVVKVDCISIDLCVCQDDNAFESKPSKKALAHLSTRKDNLTIYVDYDDNNKQLCFHSVLPRKFQEWLMLDGEQSHKGVSFEVTNALTSIFASDVAILDDILEDQGIAQVSFENQDIVEPEPYTGAQQPRLNQDGPVDLVIRER